MGQDERINALRAATNQTLLFAQVSLEEYWIRTAPSAWGLLASDDPVDSGRAENRVS